MNVEEGAGVESSFNNKDYEAAGAKVTNAANVYKSNILLKVLSNQIKFIKRQTAKSHSQVAKTMIKILIHTTYSTC